MESDSKFADLEPCETTSVFTDPEDITTFSHSRGSNSKHQRPISICSTLQTHFIVFLFAFTLGIGSYRMSETWSTPSIPDDYALVDSIEPPTTYNPLFWWTQYSDKNDTEVDALWEAMNPDHGIIAVDREWATAQHWPESMHLPTDDSKNVYVLEGYHLLHCLTIIRKSFWEAVRNRPTDYSEYTYDPSHSGHCLDALRQHVICDANPTPLYTFMRSTVGDKQPRKCRDWNALRKFATKNSACFQPIAHNATDLPPLRDAFTHCPTDDDGVLETERRGNWE